MTGWETIAASGIAIVAGGYIGVAWDRYRRRYDDHRPQYQQRQMSKQRLSELHIVDDEHTKRWDD